MRESTSYSTFVFYIGPDPADVLAAPKAPVLEAEPTQVQTVAGAAPQEDETPRRGHFRNIQRHNLGRGKISVRYRGFTAVTCRCCVVRHLFESKPTSSAVRSAEQRKGKNGSKCEISK